MRGWWSRLMLWLLFLWRLTAGQPGLPEAEFQITNCYPTSPVRLIGNVSPFCASGTKIAVENLKYACPGPNTAHCPTALSTVPGSFLEGAVQNLSGVQGASYPVTTSLCNKKRTLMKLGYYCIPDSRTLEMCSKKTISSQEFVYVMSSKYPNTDYVTKERNCKCSVVVNSNNSKNQSTKSIKINMVTIHTELEPTQQLILISPDNYLLRNISKEAKHYEISLDQIQRTAFDLFSQIEANTRSGVYWVGFKSSDPASPITVSCNKPTPTFVKPMTYPSTLFHYSVKTPPSKSSGPTPTHATELYDSPSDDDDRIWVPIVAGVVGGILLLLLIIIIIVCVVKKKQSPREKVAPKFGEQPIYQSKSAAISRSANNTYSSPSLPPISSAMVTGAQRSGSPRRIIHKKNKKTQAMFDDVTTKEETRKKKKRRKKPKRWTDVITDRSGDSTEDSVSPRRTLRTSEFHVDMK